MSLYSCSDFAHTTIWTTDPPILTSNGLSMSPLVRRKSTIEHWACLTYTRSTTDFYFLCLTLQPVRPLPDLNSKFDGRTQMYTISATGILEFVPRGQSLQVCKIYVASGSDSSAVSPKHGLTLGLTHLVTMLTNDYCSLLDSSVLWTGLEVMALIALFLMILSMNSCSHIH